MEFISGGSATYRYKDGVIEVIEVTDGMAALSGRTPEEFYEFSEKDGIMGVVFKADRDYVFSEIQELIKTKTGINLTFRIPRVNGDKIWINASVEYLEKKDGYEIFEGRFMGLGKQAILYQQLLDESASGVYVVDCKTHELLYANRQAFMIMGKEPMDYWGKTCYECMLCGKEPCAFCMEKYFSRSELYAGELVIPSVGRTFDVKGRIIDYNGREAFIQYVVDTTEKKKNLQNLQEKEAMLRIALETTDMVYWVYDIERDMVTLSDNALEEFGMSEDVIYQASKTWFEMDIMPMEYRNAYFEMLDELKSGREKVTMDVKITRPKTHKLSWQRISYTTIEWRGSRPIKAIGTSLDVTLEKNMEIQYDNELVIRNELLKEAVVFYQTNLTTSVLEEKRTFYKVKGDLATPSKFSQNYWLSSIKQVIEEEYQEEFDKKLSIESMLEQYSQGITSIKIPFFRMKPEYSKKWFSVEISLLQRPRTEEIIALSYVRDVTENYKRQQALGSIVDEEIEFVSLLNVKTKYANLIKVQEHAEDVPTIEHYPFDSYGRDDIRSHIFEEDDGQCARFFTTKTLLEDLEKEPIVTLTYRCQQKDGKQHRKKIRAFYLNDEKEDIVIARRDITDLFEEEQKQSKKLREALSEAKKANNAKSDFLSSMSHEIRTPMNAIIGMAKLAEDEVQNNPEALKYIQQIGLSSEYLLGIINDILDMSSIESGKFELHREWVPSIDVFTTCIEMIEPLMQEKGISFVYPADIFKKLQNVDVYLDKLRINQLLMNLLNNAWKFTGSGGRVSMSFQNVSHDELNCVDKIIIADTGCGMSEKFQQKLFQPFMQEDNEFSNTVRGTGLGLALAKKIVEALEGEIAVESKIGVGTTFTVTLPYQYKIVAPKTDIYEEPKKKVDLSGKRILLTEDHPLNAKIARKLLEKKGIEVVLAVNGEEAVKQFQMMEQGTFDAILMDIRMPKMDGLEATKTIRNLDREDAKQIPIIAMTANAFLEDIEKSKKAGMNTHLAKPIEPELLYRTLEQYIQ